MIQSSTELQKIALATLMKEVDLYAQVKQYITEGFFSTVSYKLIYKSLTYYYSKTGKLPTIDELLLVIGDSYSPEYGDIEDVRSSCMELYNYECTDKEFLVDKLTTFIKRNNVEGTLKELLPKIQSGHEMAIEDIGEKLMKSVNVELNMSKAFRLSNTEDLAKIREQAIGTSDNPTLIKSCIPAINNALTFKAYKPGDVILFISAPGSGKTMWMVNECTVSALQGFTAFHAFVGDMKEYDGFVRYASRITGVPQDDIVTMSVDEQKQFIQQYNYSGIFNRIFTQSYPAGAVTISQLEADIYRIQKEYGVHFDTIAIDYPDNLVAESSMMYESGGDIYNKIAKIGYQNQSVMLVGSQPKVSYWKDEVIPMEGAAESSKKQHVVDVVITAGKPFKHSSMITYHLAKVRRGNVGGIIRVKSSFDKAFLEQTDEQTYLAYKAENMS